MSSQPTTVLERLDEDERDLSFVEAIPRRPWYRVSLTAIPFVIFHFVPLLIIFTGVTWRSVVLALVTYSARVFGITAGYHRYFAHRTFKTGRIRQFLLAFLGLTAIQRGPLWWAAHHRAHHRYADTDRDPHSPKRSVWWSHIGWVLSGDYAKRDYRAIEDFARYPELRFIDRHDWIGPWSLGVVCFLIGGWPGLLVGFFASTVALWHVTFAINSVAHLWGTRRYATPDTSRNNPLLALLAFGEGWHNNHHHYPASTRQGFYWWEVDITYLTLKVMSWFRIVNSIREPNATALAARRIKG